MDTMMKMETWTKLMAMVKPLNTMEKVQLIPSEYVRLRWYSAKIILFQLKLNFHFVLQFRIFRILKKLADLQIEYYKMKDKLENALSQSQSKIRLLEEQRDFFKKKFEELQSERKDIKSAMDEKVLDATTSTHLFIKLSSILISLLFFTYFYISQGHQRNCRLFVKRETKSNVCTCSERIRFYTTFLQLQSVYVPTSKV